MNHIIMNVGAWVFLALAILVRVLGGDDNSSLAFTILGGVWYVGSVILKETTRLVEQDRKNLAEARGDGDA